MYIYLYLYLFPIGPPSLHSHVLFPLTHQVSLNRCSETKQEFDVTPTGSVLLPGPAVSQNLLLFLWV